MVGWALSAVIAVTAVAVLGSFGYVRDFVPVGLALTTTALGTLLPILHDNDMLSGLFGRYVLAAGAVGELFPIVAISLFLTKRGEFVAFISIVAVCAAAILLTALPRVIGPGNLDKVVRQGHRATAQTTLRWSIVLLLLLLFAAERFGLDVMLGALLAGMVLRSWTRRMGVGVTPLEEKLDAVGYGFFIPVFFVVSGMTLDVRAVAQAPLRLLAFFLLAARGPRAALAPDLPACPARAAAGRDDVHHRDHHAAADCPRRDRPQRRCHDSGQRGGPGRRRRAVGPHLPVDRRRPPGRVRRLARLLQAQVAPTARQGVGILGRDSPAAARLENIARFSDFISESILRAAEQVREVLHTKPGTSSGGTATPGPDRG